MSQLHQQQRHAKFHSSSSDAIAPFNRIFVNIPSITRSYSRVGGLDSRGTDSEISDDDEFKAINGTDERINEKPLKRDLAPLNRNRVTAMSLDGLVLSQSSALNRMGGIESEHSVDPPSSGSSPNKDLTKRLRRKRKQSSLRKMPSLYTGNEEDSSHHLNSSQSDTIAPLISAARNTPTKVTSSLKPLILSSKAKSFTHVQNYHSLNALKTSNFLGAVGSQSHASIFGQQTPSSPTRLAQEAEQELLNDECFHYAERSVWYLVCVHSPTRQLIASAFEKDPLLLMVRNKTRTKNGFSTYGGHVNKTERFSKIKEILRSFLRKHSKCIIRKASTPKRSLEEFEKNPQIVYYATELYYAFQKHAQTGLLQLQHYCQFLRLIYSLLIPDRCTGEREAVIQSDSLQDASNNMDGIVQFKFCKSIIELAWIWIDSNSELELVAFLRFIHLHCTRVIRQTPQLTIMKTYLPAPFAGAPQTNGGNFGSQPSRPHTVMDHSPSMSEWRKRQVALGKRKMLKTPSTHTTKSLFSRLYRVTTHQSFNAPGEPETIDQLQESMAPLNQRRYSRISLSCPEDPDDEVPNDFHGKTVKESKRHKLHQFQKYLRADKETDDLTFYFESPQIVASHSRLVQDPGSWIRFNLQSSFEARGRHVDQQALIPQKTKRAPFKRSTAQRHEHKRRSTKRKREKHSVVK